jgi:hypothetical protein
MNELDNTKDPFEELFRDRFADFESEPDTQLWNKIEPQLPVDSTRTMPYWQISTVIILMLLLGWGVYRNERPTDAKTSENTVLIENVKEKDHSTKKTEILPVTKSLEMPITDLSIKQKEESLVIESSDKQIVIQKHDNSLPKEKSLVSTKFSPEKKPTIEFSEEINSNFKTPQQGYTNEVFSAKITKTNTGTNTFATENSKENSFNLLNETPKYSSVLYQENSVSQEKKNDVTALNSRQYHLLNSQFKTPKLNPIVEPKEDEYFKESQPIDVYMSVMPLMNYYTITPEGNEANYIHNIVINNDADRLGFYTQAGAIFTLSEKFKLRTGLTFTKTNHSIDYRVRTDSLIVQSPNNKSADVSFAELDKTYSQIANYLGAKVEVQYILFKSEPLTHYVNVGLEGAYRLNGNQQFNGFANIAYGVTRQIGKNAYLFVEPTFSYSLNQQSDKNSFLLVKPNKIGFNIGLNFRIK